METTRMYKAHKGKDFYVAGYNEEIQDATKHD